MKKKILSFVLAISILASFFVVMPITANAETEGIYTYTIENGEVTITECDTDASGDIVVPETIAGYPVTSIGKYAFTGCDMTSIVFSDSIKYLGDGAFCLCTDLENVILSNSITSINYEAFYGCHSLTYIAIPEGVTTICDRGFAQSMSLAQITIPSSVTSIGNIFWECSNLTDVHYGGTEEEWKAIDIDSYTKERLKNVSIHYLIKSGICEYGDWLPFDSDSHKKECQCGYMITEKHNWDEGVETKAPTYEEYGIKTYTCTVCGDVRSEYINKLTFVLGDAHYDGVVSVRDVVCVRRFIAGGYGVELVSKVADVNKDKIVDIKDAIMLRRYITGGYGVKL